MVIRCAVRGEIGNRGQVWNRGIEGAQRIDVLCCARRGHVEVGNVLSQAMAYFTDIAEREDVVAQLLLEVQIELIEIGILKVAIDGVHAAAGVIRVLRRERGGQAG